VLGRMLAASPRTVSEIRLAQAALLALGKTRASHADELLRDAFTRITQGSLTNALELEWVMAAGQRGPSLHRVLGQYTNSFSATNPLAPWRSVLAGGDAQRGRAVFFEKAEVQCSRCHQVKREGGIVGPPLDGIGRQPRQHLLESIVLPNARIAAGYENVTLILKDGAAAAGTVKRETAQALHLESPEDGPRAVQKADIQERHPGLSAMPDGMGTALSAHELRDLVEFLASLK
jgi:quinoprotein glucose dehydrogenase